MFLLHLLRSMCISFHLSCEMHPQKKNDTKFPTFSSFQCTTSEKVYLQGLSQTCLLRFCFFWGKSIQRLHVSLTLHLVLMINTIYVESLYWLPWKHQEHQIPWNFVTWPMENSMVGWKIPLFWSNGDLFHQQFQWTIFIDLHGVYFMIW